MGTISILFANPAVKKLEERLWEKARKRYLGEHPLERADDQRIVMRKVRTTYKEFVAATLQEEDHKIRAAWAEFKKVMAEELRAALRTVLEMSSVEWYSIEAGQLPAPNVIAVPYELLKHVTADLVPQLLKKKIDFESLDDAALEALASYAADEKFKDVLEEARHDRVPFPIGDRADRFVVAEIIKQDAYYLGEEKHHSLINMVILSSLDAGSSSRDKRAEKAAIKNWFGRDRKNRNNERRFTGDGWEFEIEELKSWASKL